MQVDEITRYMHTGNEALVPALYRAEDIAFDQDHAAFGFGAPRKQTRGIAMVGNGFDQCFDIFQIVEAEVLTQSTGKKIAGQRETRSLYTSSSPVHGAP